MSTFSPFLFCIFSFFSLYIFSTFLFTSFTQKFRYRISSLVPPLNSFCTIMYCDLWISGETIWGNPVSEYLFERGKRKFSKYLENKERKKKKEKMQKRKGEIRVDTWRASIFLLYFSFISPLFLLYFSFTNFFFL